MIRFRVSLLAFVLAVPLGAQTAPGPAPDSAPPNGSPPPIKMDQVDVNAQTLQQLNSIDRKVYNVGKDVTGTTGSAADVLQNIPSVQVDIDGNVSLRGDDNVQILVDGRSTALMGTNSRADVLSNLPADSIERIEVITNPSAMYKPDGTAGIINIVLKKKRDPGYSGSVRVNVGNDRRYSTSVSGNYNPGKFHVSGTLTLRQDDRVRVSTDQRSYVDPTTNLPASTQTVTTEHSRPLFQIGQLDLGYDLTKDSKFDESVDYSYRTFLRHAAEIDILNEAGAVTTDYDRLRTDPEYERDVESKSTYEHDFAGDDHKLTLELRWEHHNETEDNSYANVYAVPTGPTTYDHMKIFVNEPGTEAIAEYSDPLTEDSRLEIGLNRSEDKSDQNHFHEIQDPLTAIWSVDPTITNLFLMDQTVTALYGTYRRTWGAFGAQLGLRGEAADVRTNLVTTNARNDTQYNRLYPTLHLSYDLSDTSQLQLNYSHRVRRPESDDLNPFPKYSDPYNLSEGNPNLKPEETHSVEAGYQYKKDDTTYLGAVYYKESYNGFTTVSQYINSTTLLTTQENLSSSDSGGLEAAATVSPWAKLSLNASANGYFNQIDATNLGYSTRESTWAWAGKVGAEYKWSNLTTLQFNANYTAKRLTPQGYRLPTFVSNFGFKHDLANKKFSYVFTISDLFNSLKEETRLNTPTLRDDSIRRRSSRIFYVGLVYNFGSAKTKVKGDGLQYDNQL